MPGSSLRIAPFPRSQPPPASFSPTFPPPPRPSGIFISPPVGGEKKVLISGVILESSRCGSPERRAAEPPRRRVSVSQRRSRLFCRPGERVTGRNRIKGRNRSLSSDSPRRTGRGRPHSGGRGVKFGVSGGRGAAGLCFLRRGERWHRPSPGRGSGEGNGREERGAWRSGLACSGISPSEPRAGRDPDHLAAFACHKHRTHTPGRGRGGERSGGLS